LYKFKKNQTCYDNAVQEYGFPDKNYDMQENAAKESATSLVTEGMKQATIMKHITNPTLRAQSEGMCELKFSDVRKPLPQFFDQVEQSQKYASKPSTVEFKHARKQLHAGVDNNFTHLLKSGYQGDFMGEIGARDASSEAKSRSSKAGAAMREAAATKAWMKTHKNPLLTPGPGQSTWTLKKFDNIKGSTDTGRVKREKVVDHYPRKPESAPEPAPAPVVVRAVAPVQVAAPPPVAPTATAAYVSTQPW
jgi:hypothetical protein